MKFGLKIILSLALSTTILLLLQWALTKGLERNTNFKSGFIMSRSINAEVLAHGSCEIETALNPDIIQQYLPYKVYNLALNHSDFADNYLTIYHYLKHQKKPRVVLFYAIPESFDSTMTNTFNTYRFVHLMNDPEVGQVTQEMDPSYAKYSALPLLRYSYYSNFVFYKALSGWRDILKKDTTSQWPTGYNAPTFTWQLDTYTTGKEVRTPVYFKWSKLREKYFVKTIKLLRSEGIKVLVYHSPIYYEAKALQINRQQMLDRIDSICKTNNVPYIQFDALPLCFDRQNYYVSTNPTIPTYNYTLAGVSVFNNHFGKFLRDTLPFILGEKVQHTAPGSKNEYYLNKHK